MFLRAALTNVFFYASLYVQIVMSHATFVDVREIWGRPRSGQKSWPFLAAVGHLQKSNNHSTYQTRQAGSPWCVFDSCAATQLGVYTDLQL